MKRILLAALAVFSAAQLAQAQQAVPQGGLETWAARPPATLAPTGWLTTDDLLAAASFPLPFSLNNVRRTATSHSGSYAAELTNATLPGLGAVPGVLILGNSVGNQMADLPGGVPYTSRAARLELYYKLTGTNVADDSAFVQVQLTRTVGGVIDVIANGEQLIRTAASSYTLLTVPLTYQSGAMPDTLRLGIASNGAENPTMGNVLTVDSFTLTGLVTATRDKVADAALSVYPTASADGLFTLSTGNQPGLLRGPLRVSDATGREVLRQPAPAAAQPTRPIDLRGQAPGVYVLRLDTPGGPLTRKLVVL